MSAKLKDQAARDTAATDLDHNLFVEAAAGTGKTTALVRRILAAVTTGRARLTEIVAITFTEKAAGELKMRLREEIEGALAGGSGIPAATGTKIDNTGRDRNVAPTRTVTHTTLRAALADLERAQITTIHSFCAWILRERPIEARVDPQFAVADTLQARLLLEDAWAAWLEAELARSPAALRHALLAEVELDKLPELLELLLAHRDRLTALPASVTLDVAGLEQRLRDAAPALRRGLQHCVTPEENFARSAQTLLDTLSTWSHLSAERRVAVLSRLTLTGPRAKKSFDSEDAFREMRDTIKDVQPALEEFAATASHNLLVALAGWLQGFIAHWEKQKAQQALLDFDDLLLKTRDLLRQHAAVRDELRQRIRFLLVDEFQDTDPVQMEVIRLLGEGPPGKLFVVGDPKQSIYSFRRADIEMYASARAALTRAGKALVFNQNFRSRSTILDWVNAVFEKILVPSTDGNYQPSYIPLVASESLRTTEPAVTLLRPKLFPDKQDAEQRRRAEAVAVARYLHQFVADGHGAWRDVALLFRSYTAVELYGEVLHEHGVPFRVIGGRGYFQRQEIQTLIALLCCLDNPNDKLNLVATLRSLLFGWTDEQLFLAAAGGGLDYLRADQDGLKSLRELHQTRHDRSVAGFVEQVFARTKILEAFYASATDGAQCVANLLKALELARQLETAGVHTLRGFVRHLRETIIESHDEEPSPASEETEDVVRLLTMHKSKGLEFPVVVLADLPGKSQESHAAARFGPAGCELRFGERRTAGFDELGEHHKKRETAEEIRLLYVAATRAKQRLVIPWFAEKGGRLDLLAGGMSLEPGPLLEVDFGVRRLDAALDGNGKAPTSRSTPNELVTMRRAWQTAHAALLKRCAQPVARVSPSKLAGEPERREEEPAGPERARAMEFGVVVHEALERMDAGHVTASALRDADKQRAQAMVERALKSELLERVRRAAEVYRELPFALAQPDGALLEGKLDLLFRENNRWVLVDYKTDPRPESEKYRAQMRAYREALARTAGVEVAESLLFFVATGQVVKLE